MDLICNSKDFYENLKFVSGNVSPFWIIEYNPNVYTTEENKYSILRNEILQHPQDYLTRLNEQIYRIWTITPYEKSW